MEFTLILAGVAAATLGAFAGDLVLRSVEQPSDPFATMTAMPPTPPRPRPTAPAEPEPDIASPMPTPAVPEPAVPPEDRAQTTEAATITAQRPEGVAEALRDLGYRAELSVDESGYPMVRSAMEGLNYNIHFYQCLDDRTGCLGLQFFLGIDLEVGLEPELMAEWNENRLFGPAYLDAEGDPFVTWYVTTEGGLSAANFRGVLENWEQALVEFKDFIDF